MICASYPQLPPSFKPTLNHPEENRYCRYIGQMYNMCQVPQTLECGLPPNTPENIRYFSHVGLIDNSCQITPLQTATYPQTPQTPSIF